MSEIILIRWGRTDWSEQGRLVGRTDLPLTEAGRADVVRIAESLDGSPPDAIRFGPEEAARETAKIIARRFQLRVGRPMKDLAAVNLGLWSGLTEEEIEQRYNRAYEQWREDPEAVCPPEGETLSEVMTRLQRAKERIESKLPDGRVAVVIGPMAGAGLRCLMTGEGLEAFWKHYDANETVVRLRSIEGKAADAAPASDPAVQAVHK